MVYIVSSSKSSTNTQRPCPFVEGFLQVGVYLYKMMQKHRAIGPFDLKENVFF